MKRKNGFQGSPPTATWGLASGDSPESRWAPTARWILTTICALLILAHPRSAGILAPLLMLAVFLGGRRQRLETNAIRCARKHEDVHASVVYH